MRRRPIVAAFLLFVSGVLTAAAQSASIEQHFSWQYANRAWNITHRFSTAYYGFFRTLPRILDYTAYASYVEDPRDDDRLRLLIDKLERLAADAGLSAWEKLNLVIAFVQAIPYASESCEYPRYPLEMLVERQGDCEDAAILAASLLRQMHYDVALLAFLPEDHMALGIRVDPPTPRDHPPYEWNGSTFYYVEPTSMGWGIGEIPVRYRSEPTIIPLRSLVAMQDR